MISKISKITLCVLLSSGILSSQYASASDDPDVTANFRVPVKTEENGVLFIDGTPYASQKDLQKTEKLVDPLDQSLATNAVTQDKWLLQSSKTYYSGQDVDTYHNSSNTPIKITLQTQSSLTAELTGSAEYNFAAVASVSMSLKIGKTYSKTFTQDFTAKPTTDYSLKSAVKTIKRNYVYHDTKWINETFYASSVDLNGGSEYWFWANPQK